MALLPTMGSAATAPQSGLLLHDRQGRVLEAAPQLETHAEIRVTGVLNRVALRQRFRNHTADWVEGIYVFPLPENAAVDRLHLRYADRVIEGEIHEKEIARQRYAAAQRSGQVASLVDQQRANLFTTSVANIPPGEVVEVEIAYQQHLEWLEDGFSLRLPTVVGPRYIPGRVLASSAAQAAAGWSPDTDQVPDASRITPPVRLDGAADFNPLSIEVQLDLGMPISDLSSPYHAIEVDHPAQGRYRVRLADGQVPADRDFVLRWQPALTEQPSAALFSEQWRDRDYALLMLLPPRPENLSDDQGRELVLVVDTSGSMHGDSIAQARAALRSALDQLGPQDHFNLIEFNHTVRSLFDRSMPATPRNLRLARGRIAALEAGGGTEMLPAMQAALHDPGPTGLLRQVVFITDGAVGNEQAVFAEIVANIGRSRLFTVGIGSAPNALLMRQAAARGRGSFTYIGSIAEVKQGISALFHRLRSPVLSDLQLTWYGIEGEATVLQTPAILPDLHAGEALVVAVQLEALAQRVEITGRLGQAPWRHALGVPAQPARGSAAVHVLWARQRIEDWMLQQLLGAPAERVREAVVALALEHHLVSSFTSLVAVDQLSVRPPDAPLGSAVVAQHLPAGWSGAALPGYLPDTATPAALLGLLGLLALLPGMLLWRRRR